MLHVGFGIATWSSCSRQSILVDDSLKTPVKIGVMKKKPKLALHQWKTRLFKLKGLSLFYYEPDVRLTLATAAPLACTAAVFVSFSPHLGFLCFINYSSHSSRMPRLLFGFLRFSLTPTVQDSAQLGVLSLMDWNLEIDPSKNQFVLHNETESRTTLLQCSNEAEFQDWERQLRAAAKRGHRTPSVRLREGL